MLIYRYTKRKTVRNKKKMKVEVIKKMKTKKKVLKIRKNIIVLIVSTILLVVLLKDNSNILINYRYNAILLFVYLIVNFIFLIREKY